jgi:hypothetical protein
VHRLIGRSEAYKQIYEKVLVDLIQVLRNTKAEDVRGKYG